MARPLKGTFHTSFGNMERYVDALLNSLQLGLTSATIAVVMAVPMAWAVSRTDMPLKGTIRILVLGAFITPPYLGAIGWILLGDESVPQTAKRFSSRENINPALRPMLEVTYTIAEQPDRKAKRGQFP